MLEGDTTHTLLKNDRYNTALQVKYKELKKQVKQVINKSRSEYYNKKLEDDRVNSSAMWNTLKQLVPSNKNKTCPLLLEDEKTISNEISRFNRYFANVGKDTLEKSHQNLSNHDSASQFYASDTINPTCDMFRPQPTDSLAAKVALGGGAKRDHVTPFLRELGWLKVNKKYECELGVMTYNTIKGNVPTYLFHLPYVSDMSTVPTRQQHQLHVPKTRTSTGARSMFVAAPTLWNSLPLSIRNAQTLPSFKKHLHQYLFSDQFNV